MSLPEDACWVDAANDDPSMLSYDSEQILGKKVRGSTDVAICTRNSVKTYSPQMGIRLALKLKKELNLAAVAQARANLLLANLHCPDLKPIVVSNPKSDNQLKASVLNRAVVAVQMLSPSSPAWMSQREDE